MASLGERRGPYSLDVIKVRHRGVTVNTIVNSPVFDNLIRNMKFVYDYEVAYIPEQVKHRPDLISNDFYGSPKNWWLLMLVNNIPDPFEGFKTKERIVIPKIK